MQGSIHKAVIIGRARILCYIVPKYTGLMDTAR
jgi:hypothetical protein